MEAGAKISFGAEQAKVLTHRSGELIVRGGGGSGRSEVIAARLAALVEGGVPPQWILVLTNTDAAANRIRTRADQLIDGSYEELAVHTYEALAERLLREFAVEAGLDPFFAIVTPADRLALLLEHLDGLPLRRHEIRGNPAGLLARLLERIDVLKSEAVAPRRLREWAEAGARSATTPPLREAALRERDFAELYERHDRLLADQSSLDRGEMILALAAMLSERPDTAQRIRRRYPHLMVDEFEDAGTARLELILGMAGPDRPDGVAAARSLLVAWDGYQAIRRFRGAGGAAPVALLRAFPDAEQIDLGRRYRGGGELAAVSAACAATITHDLPIIAPLAPPQPAGGSDRVRFWRCENDRAQAQAVAREIEALLAGGKIRPEQVCVLTRPGGREGRLLAAALEERSVRFHTPGAAALFRRPEIRDILAWLRVLADPNDAPAAVRALTRAPVQLRSADLARCTAIARRRRLDMVAAVAAAIESPQLPPESRDRLRAFLKLHRAASERLEDMRPEVFLRRLIERVGIRRQNLFAASPETAERLASLSRLADFAADWTRRRPTGSCREFIAYIAAVAEAGERFDSRSVPLSPGAVLLAHASQVKGLEFEHVYLVGLHRGALSSRPAQDRWIPDDLLPAGLPEPSEQLDTSRSAQLAYVAMTRARSGLVMAWPETIDAAAQQPLAAYEVARRAIKGREEVQPEELFGPAEGLHSTFRMLRDEVLESSWRAGAALSEMRLDTAEDVNAAVVRHLELLKLAALIQRPGSESAADAVASLNDLLGRVATPEQRAGLEASPLDDYILSEERERAARRDAVRSRAEPSLEQFLPHKGDGLALSASDIDLYRTCPLKYKFARVFAIPREPTINMRFGILLHNVLERYHGDELRYPDNPASDLKTLLGLFEEGWRRQGFGASDDELQYRDRGVAALVRYHERHRESTARPVWLERPFTIKIGAHQLRGRIDRVDRYPDGSLELIDYKTGQPKSEPELANDVQIPLYRIAARQAWQLDAPSGAYWYVLDDTKVPVAGSPDDLERVERTVVAVGQGIGEQDFEPRPDVNVCAWCDYRLICPASEA